MSIRSLADFNGAPWAVRRLAGTATVTVQGPRSGTTRRARGEDFYLATSGDLHLAISEDFPMAMDTMLITCSTACEHVAAGFAFH